MGYMGDHVQQTALSASIVSFIEKNTNQAFTRSKKIEKDYVYSVEERDEGKLIATLQAKRPALSKGSVIAREQADEDIGQGFAAIAKMLFGTLETQLQSEQELSSLNRDMSSANLQLTENTLEKEGSVLKQQEDINKQVKTSGDLQGAFSAFFTIACMISTVFTAGGAMAGAVLERFAAGAAEEGVAEAIGEGAAEAVEMDAFGEVAPEGEALAADNEVDAVAAEANEENAVNEEANALEKSAEQAGEKQAVDAPSESLLRRILVGNPMRRLKILTRMGGAAIGASEPALTSYFSDRNHKLHTKLADKQGDLGAGVSEMKLVNSLFSYFQDAVKREPDLVQEHADTANTLIEVANSYFSAERANAQQMTANAV